MGQPFIFYNYIISSTTQLPSGTEFVSATANEDGDRLTVVLSNPASITNANGWSIETIGGAVPELTYVSGSNSDTFTFSSYPIIGGDSVPLINYNSAIGNVSDLGNVVNQNITNNSKKPIPPYEYPIPTVPSTFALLQSGATLFNITGASALTSLLTGGTISGATLSGAAASGPVVIKLANTHYSGSFTFPAVSNPNWIYVVSENYDSLPQQGTRTQSGDRANMPLFYAADNGGSYNFHFATLHMAYGAQKYRFIGLSATYPLTSDEGLGVFAAGKASASFTGNFSSDADIPKDIIIDRCEIYGRDGAGYTDRKGVNFDVEGGAIIDSRIIGFAGNSSDDPMGIMVTFAGKNLVFDNLEVTASAENIIFGGTDGYRDVHDNIVIRRCWLHKPRHWFGVDPSYDGYPRTIKNLLEFKKASKVLVEDCVFEDVGESDSSQSLTAIVCTVRNQSSTDTGAIVEHVEIKNSLVRRCGMLLSIIGEDNNYPSLETNHLYMHDVLYYNQNYYYQYGHPNVYPAIRISQYYTGRMYKNFRFEHNTVATAPEGTGYSFGNFLNLVGPNSGTTGVLPGLVVKNNIFDGYPALSPREAITVTYPGNGWPASVGIPLMSSGIYECNNNLAFGEDSTERARYPSGNFFETSHATAGFANYSGATSPIDFKLISGNYRAGQASGATDGTDLGANIDYIDSVYLNVMSGIYVIPSMQSATLSSGGDKLSVQFSRNVNITNSSGWSLEFDNLASRSLTYSSGNGSDTIVFDLLANSVSGESRAPVGATCVVNYNANVGNVPYLSSIVSGVVTNNSTIIPDPDLPQNLPNTLYPTGWSGTATYTPFGMAALNALTSATGGLQPGNIVQLSGTYSGIWTIDASCKGTANNPIIFRGINHSSLPVHGVRLPSGLAETGLPTLTRVPFQASSYTLQINKGSGVAGASHLRFIGLKFHSSGTYNNLGNIIHIGGLNDSRDTSELPVGIGFNHCMITCSDGIEVEEAMRFDATNSWIVDSRFTNLDAGGNDGSTAIRFYVGSGMIFKNLYIQSESAAIFLGGNEQNRVDDVYISNIYNTRPLSWNDGNGIQKAGLLETKAGLRILIENCYTENAMWQQGGFAALTIKSEATKTGTYKSTRHLTARNIEINNCLMGAYPHVAGSSNTGHYGGNSDMLFENINAYNISGYAFQVVAHKTSGLISTVPSDTYDGQIYKFNRLTVRHNTLHSVLNQGLFVGGITGGGTPSSHHVFDNNILFGAYTVNNGQEGAWAFNWGWSGNYQARKNVFIARTANMYDTDVSPVPLGTLSGNAFPANASVVMFESTGTNDYRLASGSPYRNQATDGTDIGCNVGALDIILSGVIE